MDPNENLKQQLALAREVMECACAGDKCKECTANAERLAELIEALNEWIRKGGFLPDAWRANVEMVNCGVCGRTHENLPHIDCRAFKACSKCGDGYRSGGYGPVSDALTNHELTCSGTPSGNVVDEEEPNVRA